MITRRIVPSRNSLGPLVHRFILSRRFTRCTLSPPLGDRGRQGYSCEELRATHNSPAAPITLSSSLVRITAVVCHLALLSCNFDHLHRRQTVWIFPPLPRVCVCLAKIPLDRDTIDAETGIIRRASHNVDQVFIL